MKKYFFTISKNKKKKKLQNGIWVRGLGYTKRYKKKMRNNKNKRCQFVLRFLLDVFIFQFASMLQNLRLFSLILSAKNTTLRSQAVY